MPIHFGTQSRRLFLRNTSALGVASVIATTAPFTTAAETLDGNWIALLSDTHIPSTPEVLARGVNMTKNLKTVISQLGGLPERRPAHVFINGDCAYLKGLPADYANFAECLQPLEALNMQVHVTMGNHDDRQPMYEALFAQRPNVTSVTGKHLSVLEGEFANWFLLDTLKQVNVGTGELGAEQLRWLAMELDARRDKPAIVMAHHNPQFVAPEPTKPWNGISDTDALFQLLDARLHVHAFVYGHTHHWHHEQRKHIHLINLPPVAYVFTEGQPSGWVFAKLGPSQMELQLHTLTPNHPRAEEVVVVKWS